MTRTLTAAAILGLSVTGCSTARNLLPSDVHETPPLKVYGGVTTACENLQASPKGSGPGMPLVWPFAVVDITASAVADTFTLPVTLITYLNRALHDYYAPSPVFVPAVGVAPPHGMPVEGVPLEMPGDAPKVKPGL